MKQTEQIDAELTRWRTKQGEIKAALEQAHTDAAELEAKRETLLVAAKVENDRQAAAALDQLTEQLSKAEREAKDFATVGAQIAAKLEALDEARTVAARDEARAEAAALASEQVNDADSFTELVTELARVAARLCQRSARIATLPTGFQMPEIGPHDPRDFLGSYVKYCLGGVGRFGAVNDAWFRETFQKQTLADVLRQVYAKVLPTPAAAAVEPEDDGTVDGDTEATDDTSGDESELNA